MIAQMAQTAFASEGQAAIKFPLFNQPHVSSPRTGVGDFLPSVWIVLGLLLNFPPVNEEIKETRDT